MIGVSDDNIVTLPAVMYKAAAAKSIERMGEAFGGLAYHSCGRYADKLDMRKQFKGLTYIDASPCRPIPPEPAGGFCRDLGPHRHHLERAHGGRPADGRRNGSIPR